MELSEKRQYNPENNESQIIEKSFWKKNRRNFRILQALILFALFFALFWIIPFEEVWKVFLKVNLPLLGLGLMMGFLNILMKSIRLGLLTKKLGLIIPILKLFVVNLIVKFYLLFLPGAVIGSGIRWTRISTKGKKAEALAAVGFSKIVEVFIAVTTGLFWFLVGNELKEFNLNILIVFLITIGALWMIFIQTSKLVIFRLGNVGPGTENSFWNKVRKPVLRLVESMKIFSEMNLKEIGELFGVSVIGYIIGVYSYSLIANSIGINISIFHLAWSQAAIILLAMTPISVAGGIGIREVGLVMILGLYGVSSEMALAFSLLLFLRNIILSVFGGLIELNQIIQASKA